MIITANASPKFEHNTGVITMLKMEPKMIVKKFIICTQNGLIAQLSFQKRAYYLTPIKVNELNSLWIIAPIKIELNMLLPTTQVETVFLVSFFSFTPSMLI